MTIPETATPGTAQRQYILAADPFITPVSGQVRREVLQIDADGHRSVILVAAQDDAVDVLEALRRAYQDGREDNAATLEAEGRLVTGPTVREGTRVRLIDPPGSKVPYGAIGVAEGSPILGSGLFWAQFPQGRMDVRVSEVEIVRDEAEQAATKEGQS